MGMDDSLAWMKNNIMITEQLMQVEEIVQYAADKPNLLEEEIVPIQSANVCLLADLKNAVFKMRAFTESVSDADSFGIELGMQRAADMIENILSRYNNEVDNG